MICKLADDNAEEAALGELKACAKLERTCWPLAVESMGRYATMFTLAGVTRSSDPGGMQDEHSPPMAARADRSLARIGGV